MKNLFFILFLIPFISFCQADSEFVFKDSISVDWGKNCISKMDCFFLNLDSTLLFNDEDIYEYYYTLYYLCENGNKQTMATGYWEDLGYNVTLYSFQSEKNKSYVVLWKFEFEYNPYFNAYYIHNGKILKIGEWGIAVPYTEYNCEYCDYSVEDIRIYQRDNEIEFSFLKNMNFIDTSVDINNYDWISYKAGELVLSFNILNESLKVIEKNK